MQVDLASRIGVSQSYLTAVVQVIQFCAGWRAPLRGGNWDLLAADENLDEDGRVPTGILGWLPGL